MEILVAYDVATQTAAGRRRLRRVANVCKGFGQRVQKSVFECSLSELQFERLQQRLVREIDETEDNLRIYRLLEPRTTHVRAFGIDSRIDFDDALIV